MTQCAECEFGKTKPDGHVEMTCKVARNIKEPECLTKWMLVTLTNIERMQTHMLSVSNSLMPLQAKLLQHNCAQIDEFKKGDSWKRGCAGDDEQGG